MSFFEQVLSLANERPEDVEDVYFTGFTGALTDPARTELFVEYRDAAGKVRRYSPDVVIRKKAPPGQPAGSGRVLIVEVKREHDRDHPVDGQSGLKAMAARRWEKLDLDRLKYVMVFTPSEAVTADQMQPSRAFLSPLTAC